MAGLFHEEKTRRRQDHAQRSSNRYIELLINHQSAFVDFDQRVDEFGCGFALSKRLDRELVKNVPDTLQLRRSASGRVGIKDRHKRTGIPLRKRTFDLNPVDPDRGVMAITILIHQVGSDGHVARRVEDDHGGTGSQLNPGPCIIVGKTGVVLAVGSILGKKFRGTECVNDSETTF